MKDDKVRRSLAAIVMADVVGYSRLMGEDEPGTLRRLNSYRTQHIAPVIALRGGRIVDATGDSLLIEFSSVVDAVEAAIGVQQMLARANAALAPEKRLEYRIGVNIGDVIVQERALFGDGVNVAARLQALAAPGGLCLSRAAVDQIHGKIDAAFDDLGPQTVKNISRPIEAFALSPEAIALLPERAASAPIARRSAWGVWATVGVIAITLAGGAAYYFYPRTNQIGFAEALGNALASLEPGSDERRRTNLINNYLASPAYRAIAFAPNAGAHWWTQEWLGSQTAEEKALERCQIRFNEPCRLLAVELKMTPASGSSVHDMARVRYSGKFDPEQIPGVRHLIATRPDVAGYARASGPKAAAIHPRGVLAISVGAPSQALAEARALKLCGDDKATRDGDGPCLLYAVGDDVVLDKRLTSPVSK
jgi:class 3 adenylate cyclase